MASNIKKVKRNGVCLKIFTDAHKRKGSFAFEALTDNMIYLEVIVKFNGEKAAQDVKESFLKNVSKDSFVIVTNVTVNVASDDQSGVLFLDPKTTKVSISKACVSCNTFCLLFLKIFWPFCMQTSTKPSFCLFQWFFIFLDR